jgi:beta-mannosidase
LTVHLGVPEDFVDWHWATQLNQARAVTYATTTADGGRVRPAPSSGSSTTAGRSPRGQIDSLGRPKPLWYALRRAFAPRNLVFATDDEQLSVAVLNDTDQPWRGEIRFTRECFDGETVAQASIPVDVAPRGSRPLTVPSEVALAADR